MTPYYKDGSVAIYHGDCRDILPTLPGADLIVTDPPYGMAYKPARDGRQTGRAQWDRGSDVVGDRQRFDPAHLLVYPRLVLFGANWYADQLPASGGWLVWDKTGVAGQYAERRGVPASDSEARRIDALDHRGIQRTRRPGA